MNPIEQFRTHLALEVVKQGLDESNWRCEGWKKTWEGLSQDILQDAFNQHGTVKMIFAGIGELEQRKCKSLERVQKKMSEQYPGRENYYKVVSDFVAVRLHCQVGEIQEKVDQIREIVLKEEGKMHVRGSSEERPYGFSMDSQGKHSDITQYAYVYLDKVGYPVEMQIGHPFASHTFTVDSMLRDDRNCGKVDLWEENFYGDVKSYLLAKANDEECEVTKKGILEKAERLHPEGIPDDLAEILNQL